MKPFLAAAVLFLAAADARAATFLVTNTNVSGAGSFRQAILDANATNELDRIEFNIPGIGVLTIGGSLPTIAKPVVIDGYTQPSASVNTAAQGKTNAVLRIRLDGSAAKLGDAILTITAGQTTIRGLIINNVKATGSAILVTEHARVSILGCFIGTSPTGLSDLTKGDGIVVRGIATIGSPAPEDVNLISGNDGVAILLSGRESVVQNNQIGTDKNGSSILPNGTGIRLETSAATGILIGGDGGGNEIVGSLHEGIVLAAGTGRRNRFEQNRIYDNGALGIDLGGDGVTENDAGDADLGPNDLLNYPELASATVNGSKLRVRGFLEAAPGEYQLEFFSNEVPDPSGFGEGQQFLGSSTVVITEGKNVATFTATLELAEAPATPFFVTATSQDLELLETSEFSRAIETETGGAELVVVNTSDSGDGSLRAAIAQANENPDPNTIVFSIPGTGVRTLVPKAALVIENGPVLIDGYTQPGSSPNSSEDGSNAMIRIAIDASLAGDASALTVSGTSAVIRGLDLRSAHGDGIRATGQADLRVEGSFIGTDPTGLIDLGNAGNGIDTGDGVGSRIGGPSRTHRNLISGNGLAAIHDSGADTAILGNILGGNASGSAPLGNTGDGIVAAGTGTIIGGDEAGSGNVITGNGDNGIEVTSAASGVEILGNSIHGNGALGIDLLDSEGGAGVSANDADDADTGGNALQNFPELTSVSVNAGTLDVAGTLDIPSATAGAPYTIRVFASPTCDESGNGEGAVFLGAAEAELSGDDEDFAFSLPAVLEAGVQVTVTATDALHGNTSEFSTCMEPTPEPPLCGDASGNDVLTAGDALLVLRSAVGTSACDLCICDANDSGTITSSDALLVLRFSVGLPVTLSCPACG